MICAALRNTPLCSIPDPSSDNETYRIHKSEDSRCESQGQNGGVHESFQSFTSTVISSNLINESASFECPSCGKVFQSSKLLQEHIDHEHAKENSRQYNQLQIIQIGCIQTAVCVVKDFKGNMT